MTMKTVYIVGIFFFFQAEDGIRDLVRSRGLGDVYKRQKEAWIIFEMAKSGYHPISLNSVQKLLIEKI